MSDDRAARHYGCLLYTSDIDERMRKLRERRAGGRTTGNDGTDACLLYTSEHNKTVPTAFHFKPADLTFPDPFEQAEYIYSLIESEE